MARRQVHAIPGRAPEDVGEDLSLEHPSLIAPVAFVDPLSGDFRIPANAPEAIRRAYPRGDVPGVRLRNGD